MKLCQAEPEWVDISPGQVVHQGTARKLLDGLIAYRAELGETGLQLEFLLRKYGVVASSDMPCPPRTH